MTGHGSAHGAATVVNAMATGRGAAFGLDTLVEATVRSGRSYVVTSNGSIVSAPEDRLVLESLRLVQEAAGVQDPVHVEIRSPIPPRKGLKSSSAVALATLGAAADHHAIDMTPERRLDWAAEAGIVSGTSRTGAYDDACACLLGSLVLTDNTTRRVLLRRPMPAGLVALVHVPDGEVFSGSLAAADLSGAAAGASRAFEAAMHGDLTRAMSENTAAYAPLFGHEAAFARAAVAGGAFAAGLSGTGPAQVALVRQDRVEGFTGKGPFEVVRLFAGQVET